MKPKFLPPKWKFDPKPDITAYELAKCLTIMNRTLLAVEHPERATELGVERHFAYNGACVVLSTVG